MTSRFTRREILQSVAAGVWWTEAASVLRHWPRQVPDGMRSLADRIGLRWGVMMPAAHIGTVLKTNSIYRGQCLQNFNALAIPDFGWAKVAPDNNTWQLDEVTAAADFAVSAGMAVMGMHLLWGHPSQIPAWLAQSGAAGSLRDVAVRHVGHVVRVMSGRIAVWSVLNELDGAPWVVGSDFWRKSLTLGDMVDIFQRVRAEDTKAMLILNDFGIEVPGGPGFMEDRRDRVLRLVTDLRSHDAPIGGVGFQMHMDAGDFSDLGVRRRRLSLFGDNIRSFQEKGVQVCVTELDIRVDEVGGSIADRLSIQAGLYESVLEAALEAGVSYVSFWGLSDRYATDMRTGRVFNEPGPLLFDSTMQPKASYYAAERALRSRSPS